MNKEHPQHPFRAWFILASCLLLANPMAGQFEVNGQILVRSEYRHGYSTPIEDTLDPAGFIAHRARIQAAYTTKHVRLFMSIQDVRTWGSTSQANISDGFLSVHEAYGEILFNEKWSLKLGRQELNYDNVRFLGNLDWALQARAHDFALLKYEKDKAKLHVGGGFNQIGQATSGNFFSTPNQYRSAQLVRYENALGKLDYSALFWNESRQNQADSSIHFMQTIGIPTLRYPMGNTTLSGFLYYQFGRDVQGKSVSAYDASAQVSHLFSLNEGRGSSFRITAGAEIISGSRANQSNNTSFSLQYGTNHPHNGYMDWYFVGNNWQNSFGLTDLFLRSRYTHNSSLWFQADVHSFSSQAAPTDALGESLHKYLGAEVDLVMGYLINESISVQAGYSQYFMSSTTEALQGVSLSNTQNWAYVMLVFRPGSDAKFIGLLQ